MWGYGKHSPVSISNGSMFHLYHSEFYWRYVNCFVDIMTESICIVWSLERLMWRSPFTTLTATVILVMINIISVIILACHMDELINFEL